MKWQVLKDRVQKAIKNPESPFHGYMFNEALSLLVRERFIARAAHSKSRDALVFKGGLLLTLVYIPQARYTKDADLNVIGASDLNTLQRAVDEILAIELDDGFSFLRNAGAIMSNETREYDGAQFQITAKFGTTQKQQFILDLAVGDAVIPVKGKLPTLAELSASSLEMQIYPPETIAAEKIQACVQLGVDNSRMKDYYDLYFLRKIVDLEKFKPAAQETFKRRKTPFPGSLPEDQIAGSLLQIRWENFLKSAQIRVFRSVPNDLGQVMTEIREYYGLKKP